eukprot:TRINITY_DN14951_c1_g6_i1.p1 TRINITY_DN14951_c1_g6~~TRINITY_DN14951_c1_g6_i1.p1  ORF type:complete len:817 (+),score=79.68 TRINITY_DN14951_c1_g6_i1:81-2531(+)
MDSSSDARKGDPQNEHVLAEVRTLETGRSTRSITLEVAETTYYCIRYLQCGAIQANLIFIAYPSLRRKFNDLRLFDAVRDYPDMFYIAKFDRLDWVCTKNSYETTLIKDAPRQDKKRIAAAEEELVHAVEGCVLKYIRRRVQSGEAANSASTTVHDDRDGAFRKEEVVKVYADPAIQAEVPLSFLVKDKHVKRKLSSYVLLNPQFHLMAHLRKRENEDGSLSAAIEGAMPIVDDSVANEEGVSPAQHDTQHTDESSVERLSQAFRWWSTLMLHLKAVLNKHHDRSPVLQAPVAKSANVAARECDKEKFWPMCPCLDVLKIYDIGECEVIGVEHEDDNSDGEVSQSNKDMLLIKQTVLEMMKKRGKSRWRIPLGYLGQDKTINKLRKGRSLLDILRKVFGSSEAEFIYDDEKQTWDMLLSLGGEGGSADRGTKNESSIPPSSQDQHRKLLYSAAIENAEVTTSESNGKHSRSKACNDKTDAACRRDDDDTFSDAPSLISEDDDEAANNIERIQQCLSSIRTLDNELVTVNDVDARSKKRPAYDCDQHMIAFDKPAGVSTEAVLDHMMRSLDLPLKSVSRLDKMTSGVLVSAIGKEGARYLKGLFKERDLDKQYVCLCFGDIRKELQDNDHPTDSSTATNIPTVRQVLNEHTGRLEELARSEETPQRFRSIDVKLAVGQDLYRVYPSPKGKPCRTLWKLLNVYRRHKGSGEWIEVTDPYVSKAGAAHVSSEYEYFSLVFCKPVTGRTHQIRVHMKTLGYPLVSDMKYGSRTRVKRQLQWCPRMFLHCYQMKLKSIAGEDTEYVSPLPEELRNIFTKSN